MTIKNKMDASLLFFIKLEMPLVENEGWEERGEKVFPPVRLDLTNHCKNK